MSETATERLARMLALVPYISRRPGVAIADLAHEFGVDVEQIGADLDLLMVCGLPGYYPDDLIDVVLDEDGGTVSIAFDAGIERPVRLSADEVVALTVALRSLADLPGLVDRDAVYSALSKLEDLGGGPEAPVRVSAAVAAPALGVVRQALDESRRLWLRYYTASRDALTEREVDPIRLLVTDGHSYLEAYCHLAGAIRHFRIDRIDEVRLLDEPAQAPLWVDSAVPERVFHPDPAIRPIVLKLHPPARWVSEYYEVEVLDTDTTDGTVTVAIRAAGEAWLVRLVLSLGGAAEIVDRPDLADQVAERASEALMAYADREADAEAGPGEDVDPDTRRTGLRTEPSA